VTADLPDFAQVSGVIAFDFGQRRIGVAVGNARFETANPLKTITSTDEEPDWQAVASIIKEWQPDLVIVGFPKHLDDTPSANATEIESFAAQIEARHSLPVLLVDEKLSYAEAREQIKTSRQAGLRRRTRPGDVDKFAAQVILRTWLNERDGRRPSSGNPE